MTDWTLVGGDPAPGDPVVVRQMAVAFDNTSIRAHDASGAITRLVGQVHAGQIWTGRAALAWVDQAQSLPPDLGKLAASYGEAAAALRTYAGALEGYQSAGRRIAEEAIAAHAELGRAQADVARAQSAASAAARAAAAAHGTRNRVLGEQRALPADADPSMHSSVAARVAQAHNAAQQADSAAAGASSALQTARRAESQADQRLSTARARADAVRYSAQDSGRQVEAALQIGRAHV